MKEKKNKNKDNKVGIKLVSINEVPKGERLRYFLDYYLVKTLAIFVIVFVIVHLMIVVFRPKTIDVLNVAVFEDNLDDIKVQELSNELLEEFQTGNKKERVIINDTYYMMTGGYDRVQINIVGGVTDVVIAPKDIFQALAEGGYFLEVPEDVLGDNDGFYSTDIKPSEDGKEQTVTDEACYGVYVGESSVYKDLGGANNDAVFGIVVNAKNKQNAKTFFELLNK